MLYFNELFSEQNKDQIDYNGKIINRFFNLEKIGKYKLIFTFVSSNSNYFQAIVLFFDDFKGKIFLIGNEQIIPKTAFPKINFWEDTTPKTFEVEINIEKGGITVCNGADPIGTKQICKTLSGGCAMMIEELTVNKYRFYCNDFENDDDFDDLVFEMEIIS